MSNEELERSFERHDRQLDTIVGLLASLAERINGLVSTSEKLVRLAEIHEDRIQGLEDGKN